MRSDARSRCSLGFSPGFSLMEVLVAVVIVGVTVTSIFQLMSGSISLETRALSHLSRSLLAREGMELLAVLDPTDDDFPWTGTVRGYPYAVHIYGVDYQDGQPITSGETLLRSNEELFLLALTLYDGEVGTRPLTLTRYLRAKSGELPMLFKQQHVEELPEAFKAAKVHEEVGE